MVPYCALLLGLFSYTITTHRNVVIDNDAAVCVALERFRRATGAEG